MRKLLLPVAAMALGLTLAVAALAKGAGPVLIDGKSAIALSLNPGDSVTINAAEANAPAKAYFMATGTPECIGTIQMLGGPPPGAPAAPDNGVTVTSTGEYTFTRVNDGTGCVVTINSSDGGAAATITF